ncbi:26417_t:CDS:2, partial [Racocetra persica]
LYYLIPEMRTECESELNAYLLPILNELINEKRNESNTIDTIIKNQKGVGSHSKWCKKYNTTNIDNRKRTCSNCNEKLDTLAALQAESTNKSTQISRSKYRGLLQKNCNQLREILQSIRDLQDNQEEPEDESESETEN